MKKEISIFLILILLLSSTLKMRRIISISAILCFLCLLFYPYTDSNIKSKKIFKQPMCSMKHLYYYTENLNYEFFQKEYKIKPKYWKQAKKLKAKVMKCKRKKYRVKYHNKKARENTVMTFATMLARYTPYEENEPYFYADDEYCEVGVKSFKKSYAKSKKIRKKIKGIINYLKINKGTTKVEAMRRINYWIIGQMSYVDKDKECSTYHGFFKGVGVCRTYTYLFRHLCNYSGIECYAVQTKDHEFNAIPWGNKTLYTDVCWNDTGTYSFWDNTMKWFMIDKKTLYKDHDKIEWKDDTRVINQYI